jgi:hypothetical protein
MLCLLPATTYAISVRDIMELARAGLSDEILLALIDVDQTIFTLSPEQIVQLKKAGVSDRVIVAMLQQGRKSPAVADPPETRDPLPTTMDPAQYMAPAPQPPPAPTTTVVVVPTLYPYPIYVPTLDVNRRVHCTPGRIVGRTEKLSTPVPGRWVANGRTGGLVFLSDPVCW